MDLNGARRNRILASLDEETLSSVVKALDPVELRIRDVIYEIGQPIDYVYFILSGVASLVSAFGENAENNYVEVATIGNEGMAGLPVFLGGGMSRLRCFMQIPGRGLRMRSEVFKQLLTDGMVAVLHRYTQALLTQIAQTSACNRIHPVEERCARWLLMTHDRVDGDEFPLTQEFLAHMLGVRRAAVNETAGRLQEAGFIRYTRGSITMLDRAGLEAAACECYALVEDEYERLLGPAWQGSKQQSRRKRRQG